MILRCVSFLALPRVSPSQTKSGWGKRISSSPLSSQQFSKVMPLISVGHYRHKGKNKMVINDNYNSNLSGIGTKVQMTPPPLTRKQQLTLYRSWDADIIINTLVDYKGGHTDTPRKRWRKGGGGVEWGGGGGRVLLINNNNRLIFEKCISRHIFTTSPPVLAFLDIREGMCGGKSGWEEQKQDYGPT